MGYPDKLANIGVVRISAGSPQIGINGDLWLDPTKSALAVSYNGQWVPVSGASSQVYVGDTQPTSTDTVIWIDTSGPTPSVKYLINNQWVAASGTQVYVGDTQPTNTDTVVWFDTTDKSVKYFSNGVWEYSVIDVGTF